MSLVDADIVLGNAGFVTGGRSIRQRLRQSLIHHESLIAPIRRLPTEILSEIFLALPRDPDIHPFAIWNSPVLLTRVCSRWRDVAISTPQLWDTVDLSVDDRSVRPFTMEFWQTWLSRSGACPLKLKVHFKSFRPIDFHYRAVAKLFSSYSHRWWHIHIVAPITTKPVFPVHGPLGFPMLEELILTSTSNSSPVLLPILEVIAPCPQAVSMFFPCGMDARPQLPWAQLRFYSGEHASLNDCLATLILCPNLTVCKLVSNRNSRASANAPARPLILFKLQTLEIQINDPRLCRSLLDSLTCSALIRLRIRSLCRKLSVVPRDVLPFISRSSCVLCCLSFHNISLEDPDLITVLKELPLLVRLDLQEAYSPETTVALRLFRHMMYNGWSMIVPRLKYLILELNCAPLDDFLRMMIQSRWDLMEAIDADTPEQNVSRLEFVRLAFRRKAGCDQFAAARRWRYEGLDIRITVEGKPWL